MQRSHANLQGFSMPKIRSMPRRGFGREKQPVADVGICTRISSFDAETASWPCSHAGHQHKRRLTDPLEVGGCWGSAILVIIGRNSSFLLVSGHRQLLDPRNCTSGSLHRRSIVPPYLAEAIRFRQSQAIDSQSGRMIIIRTQCHKYSMLPAYAA